MKAMYAAVALFFLSITYAGNLAAAAACFNPRLVEQGVVVEQRYRTVDKFEGSRTILNSTQSIVGREMFKGKNALLARSESTVTNLGVTTTIHSDSYLLVQKAKKRVRTLGGFGQTFIDGVNQGTAELSFQPAILFRYDVNRGQAHTQRFKLTTKASSPLGGGTASVQQTVTRKYIGRETLRGPLGPRQTCKFRVTTIVNQFLTRTKFVSTEWYDVKSGMLIKEFSPGVTTVLLRGTIDGVKI